MITFRNLLINFYYMIYNFKPKLFFRVAHQYSRYFLGGKRPRLRYVDCILHYGCNLKCEHCSCESLKDKSRKTLSPNDWGRVAREAEKLGAIIFGIQGGEPLIYPQLGEVIKEVDSSRNFISVKTNGTIADEKIIKNLKKWKVDSVTVGFGPIPNDFEFEDYDSISRKLKNAFSTSLSTVKMLSQTGIKPMMSVVISKRNIRSKVFLSMIQLAEQYGCVLNCALAVPVGCWEMDFDLMLGNKDRKDLEEIMKQHPCVRTDFSTNWCINGCGALKEKLYISPYGDVLPCPFIHISFGNVFEDPLEIIWRRGISTKAFSEYADVCLAAEDRQFLNYLEIAKRKNLQMPVRFDEPEVSKILATTRKQRQKEAKTTNDIQ